MKTIEIDCFVHSLSELSLKQVIDVDRGVYVLWNGLARKSPSYVGQGRLMHRIPKFVDDAERGKGDVDGFVILPRDGLNMSDERRTAVLKSLERALLDAAQRLGRTPRYNQDPGVLSGFRWLIRFTKFEADCVTINIIGPNPLDKPGGAQARDQVRCCIYRFDEDRDLDSTGIHWPTH